MHECERCGRVIDLSKQTVTVKLAEADGSEVQTQMSEEDFRDLLADIGLPAPPVLCENEERMEIVTEALA